MPPVAPPAPAPRAPSSWPAFAAGIALAAALFGAYWFGSHQSSPTPGPSHNKALAKLGGKHFGTDVRYAYAKGLQAAADAITAGKSIDDAKKAQLDAFVLADSATFDAHVTPELVKIAPADAKLNDAQRAALSGAFRDLAYGVSGKDTIAPPTGPPGIVGQLFGWIDRKAERARLAATLPHRTLSQAAPGMFGAEDVGDVLLYKAWKDVLGAYPDYPAQQIGDCTSFGSAHATDLLQCIEIALAKGDKSLYRETSSEVIYGFGREIANMLGRGDGCYGVAVAKALTTKGALPREIVGPYSGSRAKQFGRSGVPSDLAAKASPYKLGAATLTTTLPELDAALKNAYTVIVCSNQGFTMTRDSTGLCEARGSWAHCMSIIGRRVRNGEAQYCIGQSWGSQTPSGPLVDDQPPFSFWARGRVVERMIAGEDSLAFAKAPQFVPRVIPDHWTYSGFLGPVQPTEARKSTTPGAPGPLKRAA